MTISRLIDHLANDLRIAARSLLRSPTVSVTAVVVLGMGVGASAAMFTVVRSVLVQRLPVRDQDRIVTLRGYRDGAGVIDDYDQYVDRFAQGTRTLSAVATVAHWGSVAFPLRDGEVSLRLLQAQVSGNFFDVLGARPAAGRLLRPSDDVKGAGHVMVISYAAWRGRFGGDPAVVGRQVTAPGYDWTYTIVGVAPPGLDYPAGADYWVPIRPIGTNDVIAVGRLAPGATAAAAEAEFYSVMSGFEPRVNWSRALVRTLPQEIMGGARPVLLVLAAAVALLLLTACVNVGNLLLLRATTRARELAIRRALGAGLHDIVRQLSVESVLLAVAGGALGLLIAVSLLRSLLALAPAELPRLDDIAQAGAPVAIVLILTCAAVVVIGLVPALVAARGDPVTSLRVDVRSGSAGRRHEVARRLLVASQAAFAVALLAGAGLLVRTVDRLQHLDLGYDPAHVAVLQLSMPFAKFGSVSALYSLWDRLRGPVAAVPGVRTVTPILIDPLLGTNVFIWRFDAEGQPAQEAERNPLVPVEVAGPGYFGTFHIPLVRGRGFRETDRDGAPLVVVVSESVAKRFWPAENPVGKRIRLPGDATFVTGGNAYRTVVGVVRDLHFRDYRTASPMVYMPWRQSYWQGEFAVRAVGDPGAVIPAIRRAVSAVDPDVRVWDATDMTTLLARPLAQPRLSALLLAGFGVTALALAAIGLYGVMAFSVRERTHELGVRMALGATPERLRAEVLWRAGGMAAVGATGGVIGAVAASRFLRSLLFEVSPFDPSVLAGAALLLVAIALVAAYLPARRATRIDPAIALRAE